MTLEEKLKLSSVSKQFSECADQQLRCQKSLLIRVECRCYTSRKKSICDIDIVIEEFIRPYMQLDFNIIREKVEPIFKKLSNLEQLIIKFEGMIRSYFGTKATHLIIDCIIWDQYESIISAQILQMPSLKAIDLQFIPFNLY